MGHIIIIFISIFLLILVKIILGAKTKQIKERINNKKLNELSNKMPENIEICKAMLKKLDNTKVKIEENKDTKISLYIAITDKITIGNIKDNFFRIQTIAHECIHSIQDRKLLLFNFVFSNIYLIYFLFICILTIFGVIHNIMLTSVILLLLGSVQYYIRDLLEQEAMQNAPYLAKEYLEENNLCTKQELEEMIKEYHDLNKIGIPAAQFSLFASNMIKFIIYQVISVICVNYLF